VLIEHFSLSVTAETLYKRILIVNWRFFKGVDQFRSNFDAERDDHHEPFLHE